MIRFECQKCGSLIFSEKENKTVTCKICGKTQRIPAVSIEDDSTARKDYDPQWNHYEKLLYKARNYRDIKVLTETAEELDRLCGYADSRELAQLCRDRIAEEQVKQSGEQEFRQIMDRRKEKGNRQNRIKLRILNAAVVALFLVITFLSTHLLHKPELDDRYNKAIAYMEEGNYPKALNQFTNLDGYKDSETYILECKYRQATKYMSEGKYQLAWDRFSALGDYKDSAKLAKDAKSKLSTP